jgi:hypothetical protein
LLGCAACSETASVAEGPRTAPPKATPEAVPEELPALSVLARSGRSREPVRIAEPRDGAELDPAALGGFAIRVHGPEREASLVLSLDGARPRPVVGGTRGLTELIDGNASLERGVHDLVLAAVGSNGTVLEPRAGGVAAVRFFVGPRPRGAPPRRFVCLSPFGTYYGRAPAIALDFVVVPLEARGDANAPVVAASSGSRWRVRAVGEGPFALGQFEGGDHQLTVTPAPGAPPALPGRCVFAYNPEIEPSP